MTSQGSSRQGDWLNIFLCLASQVPLNSCKRLSRGRQGAVAIFNINGDFYVIDDRCTHGAASLSKGAIDGLEIICPLHFGSFDIVTGQAIAPPCDRSVRTYRPVLEGGDLFIVDE